MDNSKNETTGLNQIPQFVLLLILEMKTIIRDSLAKYNHSGQIVEDGNIVNCTKDPMIEQYLTNGIGIYHVICIVIFSIMVKRISFNKYKCNGSPD